MKKKNDEKKKFAGKTGWATANCIMTGKAWETGLGTQQERRGVQQARRGEQGHAWWATIRPAGPRYRPRHGQGRPRHGWQRVRVAWLVDCVTIHSFVL